MAAVATKKNFTSAYALRSFSPRVLSAFLHSFPEYLKRKKLHTVATPAAATADNMPYDAIRDACVAHDIDDNFNRVLFMATKLGDRRGWEMICEEMRDRGTKPDFNPTDYVQHDLPLVVWLRRKKPEHEDILEQSYARGHIHSKSSYTYYAPRLDRRERFRKPSASAIGKIRSELAEHFTENVDNPGVKVFDYDFDEEIWFMIRYPGQPVRPDAVAADGDYDDVQYTPGNYDAIVYHRNYGDLRMNTVRRGDHKKYRAVFGRHLLGEAELFDSKKKIITLDPLTKDCRQHFAIEDAGEFPRLRPIEVSFNDTNTPGRLITWQCDGGTAHLFQYPSARSKLRLLPETADTIHCAKFQYRFTELEPWHSMTIHQGMDLRFERDGDSAELERWLRDRGFIIDVFKTRTKTSAAAAP